MPLLQTSGNVTADGYGGGVAAVPNYIEDVFSTYLYNGNEPNSVTVNNGIDLSTKGGLVWIKARETAKSNWLWDTARGTGSGISSNTTGAAVSFTGVSAFNTNGFTVGSDSATNDSTRGMVSWTFRKQPKFFDVVTWSGTGMSVAHSLGTTPATIILKRTNAVDDWYVVHRSANGFFSLNTTNAASGTSNAGIGTDTNTAWVAATSTTCNFENFGNAAGTYVAYLFAHNAGGFGLTGTDNVISCGSFDGTANTDVTLGYEPQWIMFKNTTSASNWQIVDNMRGMFVGSADKQLMANLSNAESDNNLVSPTATGFTWIPSAAGNTYIYIAIRRGPMKVPTSGTSVFLPTSRTGNASLTTITSGFAPDVVLSRRVDNLDNGNESVFADKLRGSGTLSTTLTDAEYAGGATSGLNAYTNTGIVLGTNNNPIYAFNYATLPYATYQFQRAPGFMDEVCYTGTGATRTVTHNLTVAPEMIIVKSRSSNSQNWVIYHAALGINYTLIFTSSAAISFANYWGAANPTSSVFGVANGAYDNNTSGTTYVSYLFATLAGVSKVGSYTGNGSTQTINCGFTGGARFVLIKRTDSTGDWYVYDTARGMTTLTDPYVLLNSTAAQTATLGSVTTVSTGFAVNASILAAINTNGASYIFLAIA